MKLLLRTKKDLRIILKDEKSPAWRIAEARVSKITEVNIVDFEGKQMITAEFDLEGSFRNSENKLVVSFTNASIVRCDISWKGQNSVNFVESRKLHSMSDIFGDDEEDGATENKSERIDPQFNNDGSLENHLNDLVSYFKKDPRNKVHVGDDILLLSVKKQQGLEMTGVQLAELVLGYISGKLDDAQMEIYDAATAVFGEVANRCFGEDDGEDDIDFQVEWADDDDGHIFAIIRQMN